MPIQQFDYEFIFTIIPSRIAWFFDASFILSNLIGLSTLLKILKASLKNWLAWTTDGPDKVEEE